jgi:hypothetical protein
LLGEAVAHADGDRARRQNRAHRLIFRDVGTINFPLFSHVREWKFSDTGGARQASPEGILLIPGCRLSATLVLPATAGPTSGKS